MTITGTALGQLVARAVPTLGTRPSDGSYSFSVRTQQRAFTECWAARHDLAAGTAIARTDVAPSNCEGADHFDKAVLTSGGVTLAARPIPAGAPLGRLYIPLQPITHAGERLTLVVKMGSVSVERGVTALQTGVSGSRLFVRDDEQHVFPAALLKEAAE